MGWLAFSPHIDRGDRAGEIHALDRAVAYDHDVFENGSLFQTDLFGVRCRKYFGFEPDIVEGQLLRQGGNRQFEAPVGACHRALERAHVDDGGTYDRAPFRIDDPSLDFQRFVGFRCILFFRK